jgi:hypothetical protein
MSSVTTIGNASKICYRLKIEEKADNRQQERQSQEGNAESNANSLGKYKEERR